MCEGALGIRMFLRKFIEPPPGDDMHA
jgi:hypothetical protein